jgi:hypothetical protein
MLRLVTSMNLKIFDTQIVKRMLISANANAGVYGSFPKWPPPSRKSFNYYRTGKYGPNSMNSETQTAKHMFFSINEKAGICSHCPRRPPLPT